MKSVESVSTDLIDISMFIILASENITVARVDKGEAILSISDPAGYKATRQKCIVELRSFQKKPVSKILNEQV